MKNIIWNAMREEGLYLYVGDSKCLRLTPTTIEEYSRMLWEDNPMLSREVREAAAFQRCEICPLRNAGGVCDAVRVPLTLLDEIDGYRSYDRVVAVYVVRDSAVAHVSHTTMQQALKYVAILGLMSYCQKGRTYWECFRGVVPLESSQEIARQMYLNLYWRHRGDEEKIRALIDQLAEDIQATTRNQASRLRLVCHNDVFTNAYANAQIALQHLRLDIHTSLEESFERFGKR